METDSFTDIRPKPEPTAQPAATSNREPFLCRELLPGPGVTSGILLFIRIFVGVMMLTHAIAKITNFGTLAGTFPDPLGLGSTLSLVLAILAETGCSCLIITGIFTRLATLPLLFTMGVALIGVHGSQSFSEQELPLLYIGFYLILLVMGGGRYGFGRLICLGLRRERKNRNDRGAAETNNGPNASGQSGLPTVES